MSEPSSTNDERGGSPDRRPVPSREELALQYIDQLPFSPYPVQEQALYTWFETAEGVLVCTPTGTGKTVIAEAAAFEALHTGRTIYYTTPLIALTEQKFQEMQAAAVRWGFHPDDVGLVTGNRRVNPQARVLVVVAEILLNRLLHGDEFSFQEVSAVVMDEFHTFADPERGIVWEFSLSLLPPHVRLLLLSATVGNARPFLDWLSASHRRRLELVESSERRVPLSYQWIPDKLLTECLEELAAGDADARRTPALVFCFSREECWSIAEELKGKSMLAEGQQKQLVARLGEHDWSTGAGPKLKPILMRGVGVHHAGILPRYRRIVEHLFQQKLLTVCVCTETLSAGINLPARSVVLPSLLKGPPDKKRVIEPSIAHQMFGRAGRPQFDRQGYVFALPHEDDVRIFRWKEKYDQIPEDTKDPTLIAAKKAMKKKAPTRSPNRQYWTVEQFEKLRMSPPRELSSQGPLPWRMLAYMLRISPEVERVRQLVRKRLMAARQFDAEERQLDRMLLTLHAAGVVELDPPPPDESLATQATGQPASDREPPKPKLSTVASLILEALEAKHQSTGQGPRPTAAVQAEQTRPVYRPVLARPTDKMAAFVQFRSVNPLYALFLVDHFGLADPTERLLAWESLLELPRSLLRNVRVPNPDRMPPGPLATEFLDGEIVKRGIVTADDLYPAFDPSVPAEERKWPIPLAEKLRLLFDSRFPGVHGVSVTPVWAAGEVLQYGGNFVKYVSAKDLAKQEGLIFRHLLRMVLMLGEFADTVPPGMQADAWRDELRALITQFTETCRAVDPTSTNWMLAHAHDADPLAVDPNSTASVPVAASLLVESIAAAGAPAPSVSPSLEEPVDDFGEGLNMDDDT
jgi:superfamily II DNA/RNA helicase